MKDLAKKVAVAVASGALLAQSFVLPAFGEITVIVSGNGSDSDNTVDIEQSQNTLVNQSNYANITNDIYAKADSGENSVDDSTGGDVSIDTGNATATVDVVNTANSNEAVVDCGGCAPDLKVEISGNGEGSDNNVWYDYNQEIEDYDTWVQQDNVAIVKNDLEVKADSGDNWVDDATGGNVSIDTGKADASATVTNTLNANVAFVGGGDGGALELIITGNGSDSNNEIDVELSANTILLQNNFAKVLNDVYVKADSGDNWVDDSTGGEASIDTGDAVAGATVDTAANFNSAFVGDCCEFSGLIKIAGNGEESDNDVEAELASSLIVTQDNVMSCRGFHFPRPVDHFMGLMFPWWFGKDKDCNDVDAIADTGDNSIDDSTGSVDGDPMIDTGDATTDVDVENTGNSNVFSTGDAFPTPPPAPWMEGSWNLFVWLLTGEFHS